jgi:hypothetical protein
VFLFIFDKNKSKIMNRIFTIIGLLGLQTFVSNAQNELTSSKMQAFGTKTTFLFLENYETIIDTTQKGTNQTWDYSKIGIVSAIESYPVSVKIVDPSTTPKASSFPSSNYAYEENYDGVISYRYFILNANKLERIGSFSGTTTKTYTDYQTEYLFPMKVGVQNFDTWSNSASTSGGTYQFNCVGSGVLKLPNDITYTNTLMVRIRAIEEPFVDLVSYIWYNIEDGGIVLQTLYGDGFFTPINAKFASSVVSGIEDEVALNQGFKFNNPVESDLTIRLEANYSTEPIDVVVLDQKGNKVKQYMAISDNNAFNVDLSDLNKGLYIVQFHSVKNFDNISTFKIVKI